MTFRKGKTLEGTAAVLNWAQKQCDRNTLFPGLQPTNFTSSWADGKVFAALLSLVAPHKTTALAFDTEEDVVRSLDAVFDAFLELGVPRLIDAEDLRVKPYPDKLSVCTYVIEMRRRWDAVCTKAGVASLAEPISSIATPTRREDVIDTPVMPRTPVKEPTTTTTTTTGIAAAAAPVATADVADLAKRRDKLAAELDKLSREVEQKERQAAKAVQDLEQRRTSTQRQVLEKEQDLQTLQGRIASEEKRRDSVLLDLEELKSQFSQAQREQLSVQSRPSAEAETLLPKGGAAQPTASRGRWWIGVAIAFVIGVGVGIGVSFLIPR